MSMHEHLLDFDKPLPEQIRDKVESFSEVGEDELSDAGGVRLAKVLLIDGSGQCEVLLIDMPKLDDRDAVSDLIKTQAGGMKPVAIVFQAEIWTVDPDAFMEALGISLNDIDVPAPEAVGLISRIMINVQSLYSQLYGSMERMPGATERLMCNAETIWGNWHKFATIIRDENGKPSLDPESNKWGRAKDGVKFSGRFIEFLTGTHEGN